MNGYYQFKLLESRTGESKRTINQLTNVDERNDLTQALHNELNVSHTFTYMYVLAYIHAGNNNCSERIGYLIESEHLNNEVYTIRKQFVLVLVLTLNVEYIGVP